MASPDFNQIETMKCCLEIFILHLLINAIDDFYFRVIQLF